MEMVRNPANRCRRTILPDLCGSIIGNVTLLV